MKIIHTLIIHKPPYPENIDIEPKCPSCCKYIVPEKDGRKGFCPYCEYEGNIEEWYKG